jgi:hypothetical protein
MKVDQGWWPQTMILPHNKTSYPQGISFDPQDLCFTSSARHVFCIKLNPFLLIVYIFNIEFDFISNLVYCIVADPELA